MSAENGKVSVGARKISLQNWDTRVSDHCATLVLKCKHGCVTRFVAKDSGKFILSCIYYVTVEIKILG